MMFRVNIPGVGQVFVQAKNQQEAIAAAQRYVNQNGIRLEEGAGNFTATGFAAGSIPGGSTVIGLDGKRTAPASSDLDPENTASGRPPAKPDDRPINPLIPKPGDKLPPAGNPGDPLAPVDPIQMKPIPEDELIEREFVAPDAAFRRFLGERQLPTSGVVGDMLGQFSGAGQNLFALQEPLRAIRGQQGEDSLLNFYERSIQPGTGVIRGLGRAGMDTLRGLAGVGSNGPAQADPFINPAFNSNEGEALRGAIRSALTGRNAFFGSRFGASVDDALGKRYDDEIFAGQQPNFSEWALKNLRF